MNTDPTTGGTQDSPDQPGTAYMADADGQVQRGQVYNLDMTTDGIVPPGMTGTGKSSAIQLVLAECAHTADLRVMDDEAYALSKDPRVAAQLDAMTRDALKRSLGDALNRGMA